LAGKRVANTFNARSYLVSKYGYFFLKSLSEVFLNSISLGSTVNLVVRFLQKDMSFWILLFLSSIHCCSNWLFNKGIIIFS